MRFESSCTEPHGSEDVHIMMMAIGKHTGSNGQMAVAGRVAIDGSGFTTGISFQDGAVFPRVPIVFPHVQKVLEGPEDKPILGRMSFRTTTSLDLGMDSDEFYDTSAYRVEIGYIAVVTQGYNTGLFTPYYQFTYGEDTTAQVVNEQLNYTLFTRHKFPFASTPTVIANSQSRFGGDAIQPRFQSVSEAHVTLWLSEDLCIPNDGGGHIREAFGVLALGDKRFDYTTHDECILIMEGHINSLFLPNGHTLNGKGVWQSVDSNGAFTSTYIYWFQAHSVWNIAVDMVEEPIGTRLGYIGGSTVCPTDGHNTVFGIGAGGANIVAGRIYRAAPPAYSMCIPTTGKIINASSSLLLRSTESLTECSRLVAGSYPEANGAVWEKGTNDGLKRCFAMFGDDLRIGTGGTHLSCLLGCTRLPGRGKPLGTAERVTADLGGGFGSIQECASSVREYYPDANGANFEKGSGECFAEYGMETTDLDEAANWDTCFVHKQIRERTTSTTTTSTTTTTLTTSVTSTTTSTTTTTVTSTTTVTTTTTTTTKKEEGAPVGVAIAGAVGGIAALGAAAAGGGYWWYNRRSQTTTSIDAQFEPDDSEQPETVERELFHAVSVGDFM